MRISFSLLVAIVGFSTVSGLDCYIKGSQLKTGRATADKDVKTCVAGKCYLMFHQVGNKFQSSQGCIPTANKDLLCHADDGKVHDYGEFSMMCSGLAKSNVHGVSPALILDTWRGPLRCITQTANKEYKRIRGDLVNQWKHGKAVPSPAQANLCIDSYDTTTRMYTQGYGLATGSTTPKVDALCGNANGDEIVNEGTTCRVCCTTSDTEIGICVPGFAGRDGTALTCLSNAGANDAELARPGVNGAVGGSYVVKDPPGGWCTITYMAAGKKKFQQGKVLRTASPTPATTGSGNLENAGIIFVCKDTNCNTGTSTSHCWVTSTHLLNGVNGKTNAFETADGSGICVWWRHPNTKLFKQAKATDTELNRALSATDTFGCGGVLGKVLEKDGGYVYCCKGMMCNELQPAFNTPRQCHETPDGVNSPDFYQRVAKTCDSDTKMMSCYIIQRVDGTVLQGCGCPVSTDVHDSAKTTSPKMYTGDKGGCCFDGDFCKPKPKKCFVQEKKAGFNSEMAVACKSGTDMCYWTYSITDGTFEQGCGNKDKMRELCDGKPHELYKTATTASWCCLLTGCNIPAGPHVPARSCLYSAVPATVPVYYPHIKICKSNENFCKWSLENGVFTQGCAEKCTAVAGKVGCCQTDNCNEVKPAKCLLQLAATGLKTIGTTSAACSGDLGSYCLLKKTIATGVIEQRCATKGEFFDSSMCHGKTDKIVTFPATVTAEFEYTCCAGDNCNDGILIPAKPAVIVAGSPSLLASLVMLVFA